MVRADPILHNEALACLSSWSSKKPGAAVGIMMSRMIESTGYLWAMKTAAFLILGLQNLATLTIRSRTMPVPKKMPAGGFASQVLARPEPRSRDNHPERRTRLRHPSRRLASQPAGRRGILPTGREPSLPQLVHRGLCRRGRTGAWIITYDHLVAQPRCSPLGARTGASHIRNWRLLERPPCPAE